MSGKTDFRDRNATIYNRFMCREAAAYGQMCELLRPAVRRRTVLELATGTGLIARHIVNTAAHIEATDTARLQGGLRRDHGFFEAVKTGTPGAVQSPCGEAFESGGMDMEEFKKGGLCATVRK